MKKFRQAKCPHCGKKVSLLRSWYIKTQGEYKCPKCGGISNIELDRTVHFFAFLAVILSGLIYVVYLLAVRTIRLISIPIIISPYLVFYLLSIFLIRLRIPVVRKRAPAAQKAPGRQQNEIKENLKRTIIMDNLSQY